MHTILKHYIDLYVATRIGIHCLFIVLLTYNLNLSLFSAFEPYHYECTMTQAAASSSS